MGALLMVAHAQRHAQELAYTESTAPSTPARDDADFTAALERCAREARREDLANRILLDGQRGRSWSPQYSDPFTQTDLDRYIEDGEGALSRLKARALVWTSRTLWNAQVAAVIHTEAGKAARLRNHISESTLLVIAEVIARFAEGKSGRNCTASHRTIARTAGLPNPKDKDKRVQRAKKTLIELGLLYELTGGRKLSGPEIKAAREHHGRTQIAVAATLCCVSPAYAVALVPQAPRKRASNRRRPSATPHHSHSVSPKRPVGRPEPVPAASGRPTGGRGLCDPSATHTEPVSAPSSPVHLSPKGQVTTTSLERNYSPSARRRARQHRPLTLQKLAAGLVNTHTGVAGLTRFYAPEQGKHVGHLCDLLSRAGIDHTRWTARDVQRVLDSEARSSGITWNHAAKKPAGYFSWRLSRIDWSGPTPSEASRTSRIQAHDSLQRSRSASKRDIAMNPPATSAQIAAARALSPYPRTAE